MCFSEFRLKLMVYSVEYCDGKSTFALFSKELYEQLVHVLCTQTVKPVFLENFGIYIQYYSIQQHNFQYFLSLTCNILQPVFLQQFIHAVFNGNINLDFHNYLFQLTSCNFAVQCFLIEEPTKLLADSVSFM